MSEYEQLCQRIITEYKKEIGVVFDYEMCELGFEFLGFLEEYASLEIPKDYTVIDLGCNQAVQAQYFKEHKLYIGIDNGCPNYSRFPQNNAKYYECSIQDFIKNQLPKLCNEGLSLEKTFAICSYVPDEEAQKMVVEYFPFHKVVYCGEIISERWNNDRDRESSSQKRHT